MEEKHESYKKELLEHQKKLEEQLERLKEIRQKLRGQEKEVFLTQEMFEINHVEELKEDEKINLRKIFSFVLEKLWK